MPKTATSKGATVQVRVGASMKQSIQDYAKARDMTAGEFVRYCIWTYMDSTPPNEEEDLAEDIAALNPDASSGRPIELGQVKRG